jgi:VCBS repeat protein/FG-GAP repeat protein
MSRSHLSIVAFSSTFVLSVAVPIGSRARAQDVLLDIKSPVPDAVAFHTCAIGDWDGDGIGDIAIGAPWDDTVGIYAGAVRIHSGKDGSILATFLGANGDDLFGTSVARMPDLDGDGIDDLAVGAPATHYAGPDYGSVYLYSGRSGALQRRIDAPSLPNFGFQVGAIGDVDGDGIADLYTGHGANGLEVNVVSGADGHEITRITGSGSEEFGASMSALDDVDGDGIRDLLVGAYWHQDSNGRIVGAGYVFSGATGALLRTHEGTYNGQDLGDGTAGLADLDGDGVGDYAVTNRYDARNLISSTVFLYSGATGAQLGTLVTPLSRFESFESPVSDAGDVNGDGVGDIAVAGFWRNKGNHYGGTAFLFSGKTLLLLDRIDLQNYYVTTLAPAGDMNGDGYDDLLVGSFGPSLDGEVELYAGDDLWLDATPPVAYATDPFIIETREGPTGTLTILVLEAIDGVPTFQIVGGLRQFGSLGGNKQVGTVPSGLAGHDFTFRAYANDASGKVIASATQVLSCR